MTTTSAAEAMVGRIAIDSQEEKHMKKTIVTFGLISGAVSAVMLAVTIRFADWIGFDRGEYFGYTVIVLSLLLVYFGIRSYRESVGNGEITFGRGFVLGISITVISCLCYVLAWEILYFYFLPGFMDKYTAYTVQKMTTAGASAAAIQAQVEQMRRYKAMYDNPLMNAAITFIEPFPIGLLMTLVSAALLRKKTKGQPDERLPAVAQRSA
jgi:hypothetical protein